MRPAKVAKMTWGERLLVETFQPKLLNYHVYKNTTAYFRRLYGHADIIQVAWVAVARAAINYRDNGTCSFGTYAANGIRMAMWREMRKSRLRSSVWVQDCDIVDPDGKSTLATKLEADREPSPMTSLLSIWCDPRNAEFRRVLPMRNRLMMYLMYVEGWTGWEVGGLFGVTRQRVGQLTAVALARLQDDRAVALAAMQRKGA